jgi:hypothetical protein
MPKATILQRFPTEKYKRFWYPTRPFFTIGLGLFLSGIGFIGLLPMSWALWLAAAFAFDDLPLTPIMSMVTAINNLAHERKQFKSATMIIIVSLSIIAGGLIGFFVLSQLPVFLTLITGFIDATSCSPILISFGAIAGGLLAHFTNRISPFVGMSSGVLIMSLLPIPIPFMVDLVFICAASSAFVTSVVTKQALRAYTKFRYGHSNADGYEMDRSETEQQVFIEEQAKKFSVTTEQFENLITLCRGKIQSIKDKATFVEEFGGTRQPITNSFKDIYHGLMNPHCTVENVKSVKELLKISTDTAVNGAVSSHSDADMIWMKAFTASAVLRSDLNVRTLYHQAQISPGINEEAIRPFTLS